VQQSSHASMRLVPAFPVMDSEMKGSKKTALELSALAFGGRTASRKALRCLWIVKRQLNETAEQIHHRHLQLRGSNL